MDMARDGKGGIGEGVGRKAQLDILQSVCSLTHSVGRDEMYLACILTVSMARDTE
jgi:hypothetical protein